MQRRWNCGIQATIIRFICCCCLVCCYLKSIAESANFWVFSYKSTGAVYITLWVQVANGMSGVVESGIVELQCCYLWCWVVTMPFLLTNGARMNRNWLMKHTLSFMWEVGASMCAHVLFQVVMLLCTRFQEVTRFSVLCCRFQVCFPLPFLNVTSRSRFQVESDHSTTKLPVTDCWPTTIWACVKTFKIVKD